MTRRTVHRTCRLRLAIFGCLAVLAPMLAAGARSRDGLWEGFDSAPAGPTLNSQPRILPDRGHLAQLKTGQLQASMAHAPMQPVGVAAAPGSTTPTLEIEIPTQDGKFARFSVSESPIMEPGLAAKFPEIKTYVAQGIDDRTHQG